MSKLLEMPKSNQQLWDDLFNGFKNQIDRRQAQLAERASGHVGEDGGWIPDEACDA